MYRQKEKTVDNLLLLTRIQKCLKYERKAIVNESIEEDTGVLGAPKTARLNTAHLLNLKHIIILKKIGIMKKNWFLKVFFFFCACMLGESLFA